MKKLFILVIVVAMLFSLIGCAGQESAPAEEAPEAAEEAPEAAEEAPEAAEEAEVLILGYADYASTENSNSAKRGFARFVDEWNAAGKTPELKYFITEAENDVNKQIADVESLIQQGCEVIHLHSIDPVGLIPSVDACYEAGVQVLEARSMEHDEAVSFIGGNEYQMAEMAYPWYDAYLTNNPDVVLNIGIIYGAAAHTAQFVRVDHLLEMLDEKYPGRINVIDEEFGDWDAQKGMEIMENWYQKHGNNMNCVIGAGAMCAVGASQALIAAGEDMDDWLITTTDSTKDALYAINHGDVDMTVGIDAEIVGWVGAEVCVQMALGEFEGKLYECGPEIFAVIDETNISEYYDGE